MSDTPTARHKPGRGSQVTDAERDQIIEVYLLERPSISQLAERFGRRRETIAGIVKSPACEAKVAAVAEAAGERAREVLQLATEKAAQSWVTSMAKAADRGIHTPARDLLLHTKTIEPVNTGTDAGRVQVLVGIAGLPGLPGYRPEPLAVPAALESKHGASTVVRVDPDE